MKVFKYLSPFIFFVGAYMAFTGQGWIVWMPMCWAWILVPLSELFIKPDAKNMSAAEEELARQDRRYDWLLYATVFIQYFLLYVFLEGVATDSLTLSDRLGRIFSMGLLCGIFGINVAHELGHRVNRLEQTLAKALLLASLDMHFFTEHNKGHHKRVATPDDPSSARYGEPVYTFYFRTIVMSYVSAWHIANEDCRKKKGTAFSLHNEMIQFQFLQLAFAGLIGWYFGMAALLAFGGAALMGILMLETVNYIEHYGLQRKLGASGQYERAMPHHSWNSDHVVGRLMLFELSRHSDHHYLASRKYQVLRHHDEAPQMPTGYPGMMLLALLPPIWFGVMNKKIKDWQRSQATMGA